MPLYSSSSRSTPITPTSTRKGLLKPIVTISQSRGAVTVTGVEYVHNNGGTLLAPEPEHAAASFVRQLRLALRGGLAAPQGRVPL